MAKRKLIETPPDEKNKIYSRLETEDGKIFMGIHPVMFGARIRCGYVGQPTVRLDWCCGGGDSMAMMVAITYDIVRTFLEKGGNIEKLPPVSDPKPWYFDDEFCEKVNAEISLLGD